MNVFIHNPYDNTYYVDPVGVKYYSWNLKAYAKKLIDVPRLRDVCRIIICLMEQGAVRKLQSAFEYLRGGKDILLIFRSDEDIRARFAGLPEPVRKKYVEHVVYFQKSRVGV